MSEPILEPIAVPPAVAGDATLAREPGPRRLVALAEVVLCSSIPTQVAIGTLLALVGMSARDAAGNLSLRFVVTLSLVDTIVLIALMVLLMRSHGERTSTLWLGTRPLTREALYGLLTLPLVLIAAGILLNTIRLFAPSLHNVETNPLGQMATTPGETAMLAFVAIVAGGVREELQRAFLLNRFERHLGGATVGVVVLSVAFGFAHYLQGWDAVVTTGTLGAYWAVLYLKRRSSVAPLVSHAAFNSMEILRVAVGLT